MGKQTNVSAGKTAKGGAKKHGIRIGIQVKLIFSVLVPVIFIVALGVISYKQASKALISNYESSTETSVELTANYYNLVLSNMQTTTYSLVMDKTTTKYISGIYDLDKVEQWTASQEISNNIKAAVIGNKFLNDLWMFPDYFGTVLSYGPQVDKSYYNTIKATSFGERLDNGEMFWVGYHEEFDKTLSTSTNNYALSLCRPLMNAYYQPTGYAFFDVDYANFKETLASVTLPVGSIIAIITPDGRELSDLIMPAGEKEDSTLVDKYLSNASFIESAQQATEPGMNYVELDGKRYLFVYTPLEAGEGFITCALVPEALILADANGILHNTIFLVVASCLVAIFIGSMVSFGFTKAIGTMMKGLSKASDGDLTVNINTKRNDEFLTLSESINSMITNVRNLLIKANAVTEVVDAASEEVAGNAEVLLQSAGEIKSSISEIDSGIASQAEDAEKCLHQMDALSQKIEEVSKNADNIATISSTTRTIVSNGLSTIEELKQKAEDTRNATDSVIASIEELNNSSASIEQIIGVINSIASQTSLLSLNASIEAARAGDAGLGFAVVADEIRKLAEQSMDSVHKIQDIVSEIRTQTDNTVVVARKSSDIVNSQDETLKKTVDVFNNIDEHVAGLAGDLDGIINEITAIDVAKKETLTAIENISAISQQTAAVTSQVEASAEHQLDATESLSNAVKALRNDSEELSSAIHSFVI